MQRRFILMLMTGLLAGACTAAPEAPLVDLAVEAEAVRARSAEWLGFTNQKDAAGIASLFATDGRVVWAGQDPIEGPAAIQEFLAGDFERSPDRVSSWSPDRVEVAPSGDLAVEYGSYTSAPGPDAEPDEEGNYSTVYRKVDGAWMIVSDFSVPNALPGR
jgi:uncharacterized protein (TIGR02246 family)